MSEIDTHRPDGKKINTEETDFIREDAKIHRPFRGRPSYSYSKQDKRN